MEVSSQDVSRRACFIPMIAKALASMLANSSSPVLASKFDLLQKSCGERFSLQKFGNRVGFCEKRMIFKCLLWIIMQHGVLNPGAVRRLTRLDTKTLPSRTSDRAHNSDKQPENFRDASRGHLPLDMTDHFDLECFSDEDDRMLTEEADYGQFEFKFEEPQFYEDDDDHDILG